MIDCYECGKTGKIKSNNMGWAKNPMMIPLQKVVYSKLIVRSELN